MKLNLAMKIPCSTDHVVRLSVKPHMLTLTKLDKRRS